MDNKITISMKDQQVDISYEPEITIDNIGEHYAMLLSTLPATVLNVVMSMPMLRPVCEQERDAHIYVFRDGEEGEQENRLYKIRKQFYDQLAQVFGSILTAGFPDIEYIEACSAYQQQFITEASHDDYLEYLDKAEDVTNYVRENFDKIQEEIMEDAEDVTTN